MNERAILFLIGYQLAVGPDKNAQNASDKKLRSIRFDGTGFWLILPFPFAATAAAFRNIDDDAMAFVDYYKLLGLAPTASQSEIQAAFHRTAERYDPNKNPGAENEAVFNSVLDAYATLNNPDNRANYDAKFADKLRANHSTSNEFLEKIGASKRDKAPAIEPEPKAPTFSQLLDFDWDALEEKPVTTKEQKKAFWDQVYFKIIVVAAVVGVIALLIFLVRKSG